MLIPWPFFPFELGSIMTIQTSKNNQEDSFGYVDRYAPKLYVDTLDHVSFLIKFSYGYSNL
jgi:hypothetical protein